MSSPLKWWKHTFNPVDFLRTLKMWHPKVIIVSFPNIHEAHNLLWFFRKGYFCWWNPDSYQEIGHRTIMIDWLFEKHCEEVGLAVVQTDYIDEFMPNGLRSTCFYWAVRTACRVGLSHRKRLTGSVLVVARPR